MKKIAFIVGAALLTAGSVVYGVNSTKNFPCPSKDSVCCPITPDCQPGDPNCVCPAKCQK